MKMINADTTKSQISAYMLDRNIGAKDILNICTIIDRQKSEEFSPSELYPGDNVCVEPHFMAVYFVEIYEKFQHTWEIKNTGTKTWKGRKLYFFNHDFVRPRAEQNVIELPEMEPGQSVIISVQMDARGFEAHSECKWIMIDAENRDCFPNTEIFSFVVEAEFSSKRNS